MIYVHTQNISSEITTTFNQRALHLMLWSREGSWSQSHYVKAANGNRKILFKNQTTGCER